MEDNVKLKEYKVTIIYPKGRQHYFVRTAQDPMALMKELEEVYHVGQGYVTATVTEIG